MSFIPKNIIIPKVQSPIKKVPKPKFKFNLHSPKHSKPKEAKLSIGKYNQFLSPGLNNEIENLSPSKNNMILNNQQSNGNLFKKEDLNKPIKIYSKEEIKRYIHLIFMNNAMYVPKKNIYLMTFENFLKNIKNFGIIPNELKRFELDILIKRICPKAKFMTEKNFMDILIQIAQKIFQKEYQNNKNLVVNYFFHNIFLNYNDIIFHKNCSLVELLKYPYSSIVYLLNTVPSDAQILILNSLLYTLNEIFEKYFGKKGNLDNLFNFCKDFEILPYILNDTQIVTYYNLVINNKDLFKFVDNTLENKENNLDYFTFNNFILFFIHLSEYNYAKIFENVLGKDKNNNEISRLIILLTKFECTKGMREIIDSTLNNLTLMPSKELLKKYNYKFEEKKIYINDEFEKNIWNKEINDNVSNGNNYEEKK
jgi:hypothetical protein